MQFNFYIMQLIKYNVHLGHSKKNTIFYASWLLYGLVNSVWIINLVKTMYLLKTSLNVIKALIFGRKPIWFVDLFKNNIGLVQTLIKECGEIGITTNWTMGIISNFKIVYKSIKAKILLKKKNNLNEWMNVRFTWPRGVVLVSTFKHLSVIKEVYSTRHTTLIAIIDTNINSQAVQVPIPGNDESKLSAQFYYTLFNNFILLVKFKNVFIWYLSKFKYLLDFKEFLLQIKKKKIKKFKNLIFLNLINLKNLNSFTSSITKKYEIKRTYFILESKEELKRIIDYSFFYKTNLNSYYLVSSQVPYIALKVFRSVKKKKNFRIKVLIFRTIRKFKNMLSRKRRLNPFFFYLIKHYFKRRRFNNFLCSLLFNLILLKLKKHKIQFVTKNNNFNFNFLFFYYWIVVFKELGFNTNKKV